MLAAALQTGFSDSADGAFAAAPATTHAHLQPAHCWRQLPGPGGLALAFALLTGPRRCLRRRIQHGRRLG